MEWNEIIKKISENVCYKMCYDDTFVRVMAKFVIINDVLTIDNVSTIHFVNDGNIWFNDNIRINIDDIKEFTIY